MKKYLLFFLFLISFVNISNAHFLWYENETNTKYIEFINTSGGTYFTEVINPKTSGINTNSKVSKFNRDQGLKAFMEFDLYKSVTSLSGFSITINAYLDLPTESLTTNNTKIRMYLSSSVTSKQSYIQLNFTVGQEWESFTFNFDGTEIPEEIEAVNGFNRIKIGFANGVTMEPATTYYIDSITGSINQASHPADWLAGSWGITFPIYGGERLDSEVSGGYDYIAGAQEIVDKLPAVGHIITNLSNFAKSYYFTLRGNENVDIATEIDESFVPSMENEAIIFEVMQKFKDAGKKNILYISTNYFDRLDDKTQALWKAYYTNKFAGDEYLAYRDLIQGFIVRVKDYADGYWLDTTAELDGDGYIADFVQMIRDADPGCAISASPKGAYFTKNGEFLKVDSDGIEDEDERDYKIVSFEGVNNYQDFTSGHVTPLGQGAPPNSWAYEEFTMPAMVENPWDEYDGKKILKHAWFPMRDKWHVSSANLIFGTEDAYRFTRTLVDAKAGVTFATTIDSKRGRKGYMMAEEMAIMKEINDRLLSNPMPDYEPYVRPEGAFLVGEEVLSANYFNLSDIKFYPNPVIDKLSITRTSIGVDYIVVMSTIGAKVIEKVWDNGDMTIQLDLSILDPGVYFVNLSNSTKYSITRRIIISK